MQDYVKAFSTIRYSTWIEADHFFNVFSLYGRERDKYTESGTAGQIVRKRDGWNVCNNILGNITRRSIAPNVFHIWLLDSQCKPGTKHDGFLAHPPVSFLPSLVYIIYPFCYFNNLLVIFKVILKQYLVT